MATDTITEEVKTETIAEAENTRGSAEPNEVAPVEETVPAQPETDNKNEELVNETKTQEEQKPLEELKPEIETLAPSLEEAANVIIPGEESTENLPAEDSKPSAEAEITEAVTPAIPESSIEDAAEKAEEASQEEEKQDIIAIRSDETGDKVYAVKDNKRYWVKNPETLAKMGFYLGKEKRIPFSELLQYPEGEPIDLTVPNAIYPWDKPEVPESEKVAEPNEPHKIWQ